MCLAVPGEVVKIEANQAQVNFSGAYRLVDLSLVPEIKVGDYVLVHAGCAIQIVPADEAKETLKIFQEFFSEETSNE